MTSWTPGPGQTWKDYDVEKEIPDDCLQVMKMMPPTVGPRILKLYKDGTVRPNDFDRECLNDMMRLALPLMEKVVEHCEGERGFLANSRSKSGFLRSMCMRAKRGELDPRGYGAVDPWKNHINAMINYNKREKINTLSLEPEDKWIEDTDEGEPIQVVVMTDKCSAFGQEQYSEQFPLTATVGDIIDKLIGAGVNWPKNKCRMRSMKLGFIKENRTLAFYNCKADEKFHLELCMNLRGGHRKLRKSTLNK